MNRSLNYWAAIALSSLGLLGTAGCSGMGGKFAGLRSSDSRDSSLSGLSKSRTDALNHAALSQAAAPVAEPPRAVSNETRASVAFAMGEMLEQAGNQQSAVEKYELAVQLDAKSLKASLALARVYHQLGRTDAALKVYQAAEKVHKKNAAICNDKGLMLAEQKDFAAAINSLKQAVKLEPSNSKYHNNLGMVLATSGDYDAAWAEFREAIGPGPAHYNVALMLIQAGRTREARDHLSHALAVMPSLREAQAALASLDGPATGPDAAPGEPELQVVGHLQVPAVKISSIEPAPEADQVESVADSFVPPNPSEPSPRHQDPWSKPRVPKWLR